MNLTLLAIPLALASRLACAQAENIVLPATSGVLNVRDARFGARGDGVTDDTAAIQKALSEGLGQHRIVYLPNGKYLVSDTLKWNSGDPKTAVGGWGPFLQLQGQSRAGTVIQLKSRAPGFGDKAAPRAVIQTGSSGSHGNKPYQNGEGNEAFENHIRNLSVDTGAGNAGAVGIDYQVSNCGAMRAVTIRSGDGAGVAGLSLLRRDNGPGLIKDVRVEGFDYAVRFGQDVAQMILEDVDIAGQKVAGIANRDGILCLRHLRSRNAVPALQLAGNSLTILLDSRLQRPGQGQAANQAAVECEGNESRLLVRALETSGYGASIRSRGREEKRLKLAEWLSDAPLGAGGAMSLGLQVLETPTWFDEDSSRWADAGAPSGGDDTRAIQAALDSGRSTVFLRHGRYNISRSLRVPRGVKRIQGLGCEVSLLVELGDEPMVRFEGGRAGDLTIVDRCTVGAGKAFVFEHADARTLVLTDLILFGGRVLRNRVGSGPLFIEDVPGGGYKLAPNTKLWARQFDIEGDTVENDGATVWALGWKTESGATLVRNLNGGRMELLGGFVYTFGVAPETPAFVNEGSLALSFQGANFSGGPNGFFNILVRDSSGAAPRDWARSLAPARGNAASVPLLLLRSSRKPIVARPAPQVLASAAGAPVAGLGATFEAPLDLRGEPVAGAMWRLDQVWPDDVLKSENYKPMPWRDDHYEAVGYGFGNAQARASQGGIRLDVRSSWGGEGDVAGSKLAALVFRAPRAGRYSLSGTARASVWQGEGSVLLSALKRDAARGQVGRLGVVVTPKDSDVALRDSGIVADLEAGQELVLVPEINGWYTGVNMDLKSIKLSILDSPR